MKRKIQSSLSLPRPSPQAPSIGFARHWQLTARASEHHASLLSLKPRVALTPSQCRHLTTSTPPKPQEATPTRSYDQPASKLNHNITSEEKEQYDATIASHSKEQQIRTPWQREGSEKKPVSRLRQASAMTKGKLLTTPTRLFKLVLPLTTRDHNIDRKSVEPLALLVHPSQPLSYLERLIQAELPLLSTKDSQGKPRDKIPDINFRAEDAMQDTQTKAHSDLEAREQEDREGQAKKGTSESSAPAPDIEEEKLDQHEGHEDESHTHLRSRTPEAAQDLRGGPGEGGVESYSGISENLDESEDNFVRWSKSTEIGDFIRDAARGSEFAVEIEGAPENIYVGVPSFGDRTYYLRLRLRKKAREIASMADVKRECDLKAHAYSQNIAKAGFGGMCGWGGIVAWLTFETDLGWDVMEPVTYLVGLVGLLGGYAWFLANNREASYRAAMNLTVSRRQQRLYDLKGFDLPKYNYLVEEGNSLRKEIMAVASEYDVEWDEKRDAQDERVVEALKESREGKKKGRKEEDDD